MTLRVPEDWKRAADEAERRGVGVDVVGRIPRVLIQIDMERLGEEHVSLSAGALKELSRLVEAVVKSAVARVRHDHRTQVEDADVRDAARGPLA
jgi:hypothetical protein